MMHVEELWRDLKSNPALLVALLVVAGIGLIVAIRRQQSSSSTGTTATPLPQQQAGGSGNGHYLILEEEAPPTTTTTVSVSVPAAPAGSSGASSSGSGSSSGSTTTGGGLPYGIWTGPTGVLHYTVQAPGESVAQIAHRMGLQVGAINAIPDNIKHYPQQMNNVNLPLPPGAVITVPPAAVAGH